VGVGWSGASGRVAPEAAVVHIGTRYLAGTGVPIGHIAFGDPATVYAPRDAPAVHAQLSALGFTREYSGWNRNTWRMLIP